MPELCTLRVLIAEDHALVRQGMAALLATEVGSIVEVEDGEQALDTLKKNEIDIALIDIGLPKRTGMDVLSEIRRRQYPVKVIILTGDTDKYSPAAATNAGADAFLYKTTDADRFMAVFHAVAKGHSLPDQQDIEGKSAKTVAQLRETLTARELQITKIIAEGKSNRQAAMMLDISEHTVRKHREHINRKLSISSPTALAAFAIKVGLI